MPCGAQLDRREASTPPIMAPVIPGLMTVWSGEVDHTAAIVAMTHWQLFMTCSESSFHDRPHRCRRRPAV
jgi:hypothetical protein